MVLLTDKGVHKSVPPTAAVRALGTTSRKPESSRAGRAMPNEGQPLAYLDLLREETLRAGRFGLLKMQPIYTSIRSIRIESIKLCPPKGKQNASFSNGIYSP